MAGYTSTANKEDLTIPARRRRRRDHVAFAERVRRARRRRCCEARFSAAALRAFSRGHHHAAPSRRGAHLCGNQPALDGCRSCVLPAMRGSIVVVEREAGTAPKSSASIKALAASTIQHELAVKFSPSARSRADCSRPSPSRRSPPRPRAGSSAEASTTAARRADDVTRASAGRARDAGSEANTAAVVEGRRRRGLVVIEDAIRA